MSKIVYGHLSPAAAEVAIENGWILGGCIVTPILFYCKACGVSWSEDGGFDKEG